jgi:hypothetical protein
MRLADIHGQRQSSAGLRGFTRYGRTIMAWNILLTTDIGLLSLFTILFMVGMAVFIYFYVMRRVKDVEAQGSEPGDPSHAH